MKKWMVVPILIVALFLGLPNHATATETAKNDTVYVAGNPVFRNGIFLGHDLGKVLEKCEKILADIETRL